MKAQIKKGDFVRCVAGAPLVAGLYGVVLRCEHRYIWGAQEPPRCLIHHSNGERGWVFERWLERATK